MGTQEEIERLKDKLDTMWGAANYRLKYIDDLMQAAGFVRPDERVEAHVGAACEFIRAMREKLGALASGESSAGETEGE